jgi:acetyl-CoA carboxylase biotin carboxyl carrier protein
MSEKLKLLEELAKIAEAFDLLEVEFQEGEIKLRIRRKGGKPKEERKKMELRPGTKVIVSPFVGTFYRAPSPGAPPFVNVGDRIQKGQVLCIIESMKIMNEVESDVDGKIISILVEDGETVEYGQELFIVHVEGENV